jgi:hypothetical protein
MIFGVKHLGLSSIICLIEWLRFIRMAQCSTIIQQQSFISSWVLIRYALPTLYSSEQPETFENTKNAPSKYFNFFNEAYIFFVVRYSFYRNYLFIFLKSIVDCHFYMFSIWCLWCFSCLMQELEKSKPVILTGDLNCAHEEIDIYNPTVSDLDFQVVYESLL